MKLKDYIKQKAGFESQDIEFSYEAFESAVELGNISDTGVGIIDDDIDKAINIVDLYHNGFEDNKEEIVKYLNGLSVDLEMPAFESSVDEGFESIGSKIKTIGASVIQAIIDAIEAIYKAMRNAFKKLKTLHPVMSKKIEAYKDLLEDAKIDGDLLKDKCKIDIFAANTDLEDVVKRVDEFLSKYKNTAKDIRDIMSPKPIAGAYFAKNSFTINTKSGTADVFVIAGITALLIVPITTDAKTHTVKQASISKDIYTKEAEKICKLVSGTTAGVFKDAIKRNYDAYEVLMKKLDEVEKTTGEIDKMIKDVVSGAGSTDTAKYLDAKAKKDALKLSLALINVSTHIVKETMRLQKIVTK